MASCIQVPWIRDYLVNIAETYGTGLSSVPSHSKSEKVQLVQFLTYHQPGQDSWIWAILSDKVHSLTVRFSKEAMESYEQDPRYSNKSLTDFKTAFMTIKHFRPMLSRVPLAGDHKGMSESRTLSLDVGHFDLIGAFRDPRWGSPKDIESDEMIHLWVEGLRKDGGDGNILKVRKQERERAAAENKADNSTRENIIKTRTSRVLTVLPQKMTQFGRKSVRPDRGRELGNEKLVDDAKSYKRKWRSIAADSRRPLPTLGQYRKLESIPFDTSSDGEEPPAESKTRVCRKLNALDMGTSSPGASPVRVKFTVEGRGEVTRFPPATPSNWSPSVRGSQIIPSSPLALDEHVSEDEANPEEVSGGYSPMKMDARDDTGIEQHSPEQEGPHNLTLLPIGNIASVASSSFPAPTPAQRQKVLEPSSSLPFPSPSSIAQLTLPSSLPADLPHSSTPPSLPRKQKTFTRKVPPSEGDSFHPNLSGPGNILVPNSDTSGTAASQSNQHSSQSMQHHSQSQSQSQSQGQSQSQQRYSQSLSYTSASQGPGSGESQPRAHNGSQPQSQSQPHSQGLSRLRNEVLPSDASEPVDTLLPQHNQEAQNPIGRPSSSLSHESGRKGPTRTPSLDAETSHRSPAGVLPKVTSTIVEESEGRADVTDSETEEEDELDVEDADDEAESGRATLEEPSYSSDEAGSSTEVDQLESDDARTEAMVHRYGDQQSHIQEESPAGDVSPPAFAEQRSPSSSPQSQDSSLMESSSRDPSPKAVIAKHHVARKRALGMHITNQIITERRDAQSSIPSSDLPARPSSPDVFINEESFYRTTSSPERDSSEHDAVQISPDASEDVQAPGHRGDVLERLEQPDTPAVTTHEIVETVTSALGTVSNHDVEAWSAPSFIRARSNAKSALPTKKELTQGKKRHISVSSGDEEPRPAKRQKVLAKEAISIPTSRELSPPRAKSVKDSQPSGPSKIRQMNSLASTTSKFRQIDLHQSASVSSSVSLVKRRMQSHDSTEVSKALRRGLGDRTTSSVSSTADPSKQTREVDTHVGGKTVRKDTSEVNHSNSRLTDPSNITVPVVPHRERKQRSSSGASVSSSHNRADTQGSSSKSRGVQDKVIHGSLPIPPFNRTEGPASSTQVRPRETPPTSRATSPLQKLGGYKLDLHMTQENGLPPVTWDAYHKILCRLGNAGRVDEQEGGGE